MNVPALFFGLSWFGSLFLTASAAEAVGNDLRRPTRFGIVEGRADEERGVLLWKAVPFASPPVGPLRWKAPVDPIPWTDVLKTQEPAPPCLQFKTKPSWAATNEIIGSEDCLYLDIYRPATEESNLPVYVWIHGGGNFGGSARQYYMEDLAKTANFVVVVIQYRLSVFGYFTHPALRAGVNRAAASGNFGLLDQLQALRWVQENIAAFGGNPFNVTIAGESAGGHNVLGLMISPLARGLFHRIVMQSGGMVSQRVSTIDNHAEGVVHRLLSAEPPGSTQQGALSKSALQSFLRDVDARQLLQAHAGGPIAYSVPLGNLIEDGYVIPGPLLTTLHSGNYCKVPIILGANRSESGSVNTFMQSAHPGMPNYQELIDVVQGDRNLDDVLPTDKDKELWSKARNYGSRFWCATMVDEVAGQLKRHQDDVFVYSFDWGESDVVSEPLQFIYGAAHALEIPFFHAATDRGREWTNDSLVFSMLNEENRRGRLALSDDMVVYLSRFARTGNPNGANTGLPVWDAWSLYPGGPKRIVFDADLTRARIRMSHEELSVAGVRFQLDREPSEIRDHVLTVLTTLHDFVEYERGDYQYGRAN